MSGMPRVCYVAALVFMTMTHDCMSRTTCQCRLVCSVTGVDIIPGTRDGMSAATVGLRTSGTGQHRSRHRTQTSVISKQPPESGGTSQGCGVTLVRTLEASIKTLWLRIRRNKHLIKPRKSNCTYLPCIDVGAIMDILIHSFILSSDSLRSLGRPCK